MNEMLTNNTWKKSNTDLKKHKKDFPYWSLWETLQRVPVRRIAHLARHQRSRLLFHINKLHYDIFETFRRGRRRCLGLESNCWAATAQHNNHQQRLKSRLGGQQRQPAMNEGQLMWTLRTVLAFSNHLSWSYTSGASATDRLFELS